MANVIQILIEAKDNASAKLAAVNGEVAGLGSGVGVATVALGAAGVVVGALGLAAGEAARRIADLGKQAEQLNNLAARTGGDASGLMATSKQLADMGIDAGALGVSLKFLQKHIGDNDDVLTKYGITAKTSMGALSQISDMFNKMADGPEKTTAALDLLGNRGGSVLIQFLNQGSAKIADFNAQLVDMGVVLDDSAIDRFAAFDDAGDKLHNRLEGLQTILATDLLPVMESFVGALDRMAQSAQRVAQSPLWATLGNLAGSGGRLAENQDASVHAYLRRMGLAADTGGGGASWSDSGELNFRSGMIVHGGQGFAGVGGGGKAGKSWPMGSGGYVGMFGPQTYGDFQNGQTKSPFKGLSDDLSKVTIPMLKFGDKIKEVSAFATAGAAALKMMATGIAGNISQAVSNVLSGTQGIAQAFAGLMRGIMQSIAEAAAKAGIGLGLTLLGTAIGGPVGGFVGSVGGQLMGATSSGGSGGGNTYVIQSINAKDVLDALVSPTGSLRGANSRLRDIAAAA